MMRDSSRAAHWIRFEVARKAFESVARALASRGVEVMPVKGIVLARTVYADVVERPFGDVDILVRRGDFLVAKEVAIGLDPRPTWVSDEMGELGIRAHDFEVELHAEIGRPHLTKLSVDDLFDAGEVDSATFSVSTRAISHVDHLLLLATNVVKDRFIPNPQHPGDLQRLLPKVDHAALAARAAQAGFSTALAVVAAWMASAHHARAFGALANSLTVPRPRYRSLLARLARGGVPRSLGLAIACAANDDRRERTRSLALLARRGLFRAMTLDPG